MDWPIDHLIEEDKAASDLLELLHPEGLFCPGCGGDDFYRHSSTSRVGLEKQRCRDCGKVFHFLTATSFNGTHFPCSKILLIMRGFAKGQSTAELARELGIDRTNLLDIRHRLQKNLLVHRASQIPLLDEETETDEAYQNAGEKGIKHSDPKDPPRKRANKKKGPELLRTTVPE